jgi:GTP-binding protein
MLNNKYYFTDLPGYWFAKLGKNVLEKLDALISWYLEAKIDSIKKVVMLIDTKIWPQQTDIDMYKYILDLWIPVAIVLSKVDRLSKNEIHKSKILAAQVFYWQDIFPISSSKNIWIKELNKYLGDALEGKK